MGLPCANQPLLIEFKGGITLNYPMQFNQDTITFLSTQSNFPINKLGISLNTDNIFLEVDEKKEILTTPIRVPVDCNPQGYIEITEVTVNTVSVLGCVQFVTNADLFANNTISIPNGVNLAWPSASGAIYVDKTLLIYTDNLNDNYKLDISVESLELDSATNEGDSDLYVFIVSGILKLQATKI